MVTVKPLPRPGALTFADITGTSAAPKLVAFGLTVALCVAARAIAWVLAGIIGMDRAS